MSVDSWLTLLKEMIHRLPLNLNNCKQPKRTPLQLSNNNSTTGERSPQTSVAVGPPQIVIAISLHSCSAIFETVVELFDALVAPFSITEQHKEYKVKSQTSILMFAEEIWSPFVIKLVENALILYETY